MSGLVNRFLVVVLEVKKNIFPFYKRAWSKVRHGTSVLRGVAEGQEECFQFIFCLFFLMPKRAWSKVKRCQSLPHGSAKG